MDDAIAWIAFFGGWLLFAGPIFQAAVELREEEIERDAIAKAASNIEPVPMVSPWWWLLPPVYYAKNRRRRRALRDATFAALPTKDLAAFVSFMDKAHGWLTVAVGALCIAIKETWELADHTLHCPLWSFVLMCLVMFVLALMSTVAQISRGQSMLRERGVA